MIIHQIQPESPDYRYKGEENSWHNKSESKNSHTSTRSHVVISNCQEARESSEMVSGQKVGRLLPPAAIRSSLAFGGNETIVNSYRELQNEVSKILQSCNAH